MEIDKELFSIAFRNLKTQKLRSSLTLLGIVIGITAIVFLFSLGEGLNQAVTQEVEKIGLDTVLVEPGTGMGLSTAIARTLKDSDIQIIEGIAGIEHVMGFYETSAIVKFKEQQAVAFIIGTEPGDRQYLEKAGYIEMTSGRYLEPNDNYAIVIPKSFVDVYEGETLRVRDQLEINGQKFKIVGITENMSGAFGGFATNMLWLPKETVQDFFGEENPTEIIVQATDRSLVDEVADEITERLKRAHGEEDFYAMTTENVLESAGMVIGLIQLVVVALAAISLIVGGIGIMNTMLMAVLERTKEIGVMKAIGATNTKVLSIFLAEAAIIGGIGGVIGTALGLSLASLASAGATALGYSLPAGINVLAIIGAIAFAMLVGMISGYVPARRAARLDPVHALRYGT